MTRFSSAKVISAPFLLGIGVMWIVEVVVICSLLIKPVIGGKGIRVFCGVPVGTGAGKHAARATKRVEASAQEDFISNSTRKKSLGESDGLA